jgi:hypothetical protein
VNGGKEAPPYVLSCMQSAWLREEPGATCYGLLDSPGQCSRASRTGTTQRRVSDFGQEIVRTERVSGLATALTRCSHPIHQVLLQGNSHYQSYTRAQAIYIQHPAMKIDGLYISTNLESIRFPCRTLYYQHGRRNCKLPWGYIKLREGIAFDSAHTATDFHSQGRVQTSCIYWA